MIHYNMEYEQIKRGLSPSITPVTLVPSFTNLIGLCSMVSE